METRHSGFPFNSISCNDKSYFWICNSFNAFYFYFLVFIAAISVFGKKVNFYFFSFIFFLFALAHLYLQPDE